MKKSLSEHTSWWSESWKSTMYESGIPANDALFIKPSSVYFFSLFVERVHSHFCYHYFTSLCSYILDHLRAQHDHFSVIVPWVLIISGLCCYYYFMSLHESDCVHVSLRLLVLKPISIIAKSKKLYWISFAFLYVCI